MKNRISQELKNIAAAIRKYNGEVLVVGGYVRDYFLNLPSKDLDLEVYGLNFDQLREILSPFGKVDVVGEHYSVLKLTTTSEDYDFALPRTETKTGEGYKGFKVIANSYLDYKSAFARRDFTFNAIGYDITTNSFVNVYGGMGDIKNKILRHTSDCFAEDPTRVLRAMQFLGRFGFTIEQSTVTLCASLITEFDTIPKERIFGEFEKLLLKSKKPSVGFEFLVDCGWIKKFPELDALHGVQQKVEWHPEGDVWVHTMHVLDAATEIARRENLDKKNTTILLLAALCHDLGKQRTTVQKERGGVLRWTAPQHDKAGVKPTLSLLERMGVPKSMWKEITTLVAEHMAHINEMGIGGVRRLINRLGEGGTDLKMLSMVVEADLSGRPPLVGKCPDCFQWFFEVEQMNPKTQIGKIAPIITGEILLQNGFTEGKELGQMFKKLYELQLDGQFNDIENGLKLI